MKHKTILLLSFLAIISCKKEGKNQENKTLDNTNNIELTEKQNNGLITLKGKFIFYDGAGVIQTNTQIYGVLPNSKVNELNTLAQQYKNQPTDMVQVEIRGHISNQKNDTILWENKIEIIEILNVSPENTSNNIIKLGDK